MNYCSNCGSSLSRGIPPLDDRLRYICDSCKMVHYQNPTMVVGCIPEYEGKILLCRRAIEPRLGYWTIPAGFLENEESVADGAVRETLEETGSKAEIIDLFTVFTLLRFGQVYLIFRARLLDENFGPTKESTEVRLFSEDEIPWNELAFETVIESLKLYYSDKKNGKFGLHQGTIPLGGL